VEGSACHPALAAANLQTLAGTDALQALAGDRLEQLGGWSQQLATASVRSLLRPLEPLAEAGGWWCSGLDPLADWAPMGWGCFKPDAPRWDQERGRHRKYEHPVKVAARLFWLCVPAPVAQLVADRFGLPLPPEVAADADGAAGAFWRWWAREPRLPLLVTEGARKGGALLSVGIPAIAAPGIWNACPRPTPTDRPALLPELAAAPLKGRRCWVLFDHPDRSKRKPAEPKAARRLGRLLAAAGAAEVLVGTVPGTHGKGADDHLAAGGSWEQMAAALQPLALEPVLPRLRPADRIAPAGQWLGVACPIPSPDRARVVALKSAMGSGKTEAIAAAVAPLLEAGTRVVLISHRRSLGAALAERLGLPWADEAAPGSDLRQLGIALCIDSLCADSGLRFRASDWAGAVVVIDEAAAVVAHSLMAAGTAVAQRRPRVLATLAALLANARQVIAADAQLSDPVLQALEAAAGERALLIASHHRPATGRGLLNHPSRESWRLALVEQLQQRSPIWIATTAQQPGAPNSAQNLAALVAEHWPEARTLLVDSQTVADPNHPASQLATDPDGIAGAFDVVIATPAVAAGLSVTLQGHFRAVFGWAGGTTDPAAVAQALARVRDGCPRHLYAPERSPGGALRVGCGSTDPAALLRRLSEHEAAAVAQLLAAGGWSPAANTAGPWLPCWAQLAATLNGQRQAFRATVLALLEREGYRIETAPDLAPQQQAAAGRIADQLKAIATASQAAADLAVIEADPLTDREAADLAKRRRLSPADRARLQRHRIATAWGLGTTAPTAELLEADRERLDRRIRFGWLVRSSDARQLVARADLAKAKALAPDGASWSPDLCRELEGPRLTAADALGLPSWIQRAERGDWFTADDAQLLQLQATATAHSASMAQALGLTPGKRATTTLRQLLALAGLRLVAQRCRSGRGRLAAAGYRYRIEREALPVGVDPFALVAAWERDLQAQAAGVCTKTPHS
ncbi:MAG: hypothetical protein RLZZ589_1670, partial [Cyanobacteriota bacterium]